MSSKRNKKTQNVVPGTIPAGNLVEKIEKKKPPFYFYLLLACIPIMFFLLLEITLRLTGYGNNYQTWIEQSYNQLTLNPEIARRYFFNSQTIPTPNGDKFDKVKGSNTFRVFVLGESSAAGYPYLPNGSLAQFLRKKLELSFPEKKIEVVNLGLTAINTFTIKDILPDVIGQKPDLLIIYTGHNEFYGALGVASSESILSNPGLTDFLIKLRSYRTVQLVNNFIGWIHNLFAGESGNTQKRESLMAKMIGNEMIELNSDLYKRGLEQFKKNMASILQTIKDANVNAIVGTPVSNLLQKPFYLKEKENPANKFFEEAQIEIKEENFAIAKKLLLKARDNDVIRFRAPSEFSDIVTKLGSEFRIPVINFDSLFTVKSPNRIIGYNLMVDHLHPTIEGYWQMGKSFCDVMSAKNFLPGKRITVNDDEIFRQLKLTPLDSILAYLRVNLLINSYPFSPPGTENQFRKNYKPVTSIDTIAAKIMDQTISWEQAHELAAEYYLKKNDLPRMISEVKTIIEHNPVNQRIKTIAANLLIKKGLFDEATFFLNEIYKIEPDEFSTKWLGSINLTKGNSADAKKYLEQSIRFNPNDQQTLYNLAGAYYNLGDTPKTIDILKKCLSLNPNYEAAKNFYNQLISITN